MPYRPSTKIADALIAEQHQIRLIIANAVNTSFNMAFYALHKKPGEVEKLIYFFMEGLSIIETNLNRLLKPYKVSVVISGIFCHQTPKVKSITPQASLASCELGDIALLATYENMPSRTGLGNALLLQAKEVFRPGASPNQELLYETTDIFEYASPRPLTSKNRSLTAAQFCLYYWDLSYYGECPYLSHPVNSTLAILARPKPTYPTRHYHFAFEDIITNLFCGIAGRGFKKKPTGNGWSAIIHDLVKNSAVRTVTHNKIFSSHGKPKPSRLYNYVSALHDFGAKTMVRCSLSKFLNQFGGDELQKAGAKLEAEARNFDWQRAKPQSEDQRKNFDLPPLDRGDDSDDGSGSGSFVVFQFRSNVASKAN